MRPRPPRCTKVKYSTKTNALRALRRMMRSSRHELRPYRCGKHNKETWHLTSNVRY